MGKRPNRAYCEAASPAVGAADFADDFWGAGLLAGGFVDVGAFVVLGFVDDVLEVDVLEDVDDVVLDDDEDDVRDGER